MVAGRLGRVWSGLFDAVFRPAVFVAAPSVSGWESTREGLRRVASLLFVYVTNVVLYALPLTLAGFGVSSAGTAPSWFGVVGPLLGDPELVWRLGVGTVQNSAYLTALSAVTLVSYHTALTLTRSSSGILPTLHTVIYSASAYLAGIFTVVVFLSQHPGYGTAEALVRDVQIRFISEMYDAFAIPPSQRVFRPSTTLSPSSLTDAETAALAVLGALVVYFLYSLYLGTRLNHDAGVLSSLASVVAVLFSPVIYVSALIIYSTGTIGL